VSNSLTGDFDAVLQVGNTTLDRLCAAMHQNGFPHQDLPSLPHVGYFRVEQAEHGSVAAQIGCPHVVLVDGSTDRFKLEIGFRAAFHADPGSEPLADIINGTIHATYRVHDIDPTCEGWQTLADDYVWLRAIRSSVIFHGSAYNESNRFVLSAVTDQSALAARISKHLASLLADGFAPRPHPIGRRFKRFRSLVEDQRPGGSALAFPFALDNTEPTGALSTITELFLDGSDFAVAVSGDFLVEHIISELSGIEGQQRNFHIHGDAGYGGGLEIDYHARIDSVDVQWLGSAPFGMPMGIVRITARGRGWASRLYRSGVFNIGSVSLDDIDMAFTVEQYLTVQFTAAGQFAVAAAGGPLTTVLYDGPFASQVSNTARQRVSELVEPLVKSRLQNAENSLRPYAGPEKIADLVNALKTVDPAAGARFDRASFRHEGLVLHGSITLASRWSPRVQFTKTGSGNGFDAIESWIPGGRVDRFEWSWRWYTNPVQAPPGQPGAVSEEDSFRLRRPHNNRNPFGLMTGVESPLPGLDGLGRVCLRITGHHVDPVTGVWVPVESTSECVVFGYEFRLPVEVGPYLRICDPLRRLDGRAAEVGVMPVAVPETDRATNALVGYVRQGWDVRAAEAVMSGLAACRRRDAGRNVHKHCDEGGLAPAPAETIARLQNLSEGAVAPVLVAEDVGGRWAQHVGADAGATSVQWRLLDPAGAVRWAPDTEFDAEEVTRILNERLTTSRRADLAAVRPGPAVGSRLEVELSFGRCPPIPVKRPDGHPARILFADMGPASADFVDALANQRGADEPLIAVVVREASVDETHVIAAKFDGQVPVVADPTGAISRRAGIGWTPAVVGLDAGGHVTELVTEPTPTDRTMIAR
jgi:hypothetical protein